MWKKKGQGENIVSVCARSWLRLHSCFKDTLSSTKCPKLLPSSVFNCAFQIKTTKQFEACQIHINLRLTSDVFFFTLHAGISAAHNYVCALHVCVFLSVFLSVCHYCKVDYSKNLSLKQDSLWQTNAARLWWTQSLKLNLFFPVLVELAGGRMHWLFSICLSRYPPWGTQDFRIINWAKAQVQYWALFSVVS